MITRPAWKSIVSPTSPQTENVPTASTMNASPCLAEEGAVTVARTVCPQPT